MRKHILLALCAAIAVSATYARPTFNKNKDIIIAQFDSKPDPDDIHAQAALGCMLAHSSLSGVNYYAVAGAYGNQTGAYITSRGLFTMAFGAENSKWTDAHLNYWGSVNRIRAVTRPILQNGGKVWVAEAGQSKITADWMWALQNTDGIAASVIKANVIIVQHSKWNEDHTPAGKLQYAKDKGTYYAIDDGNDNYGSTASWSNRGPYSTPNYRHKSSAYMANAKTSQNAKAKQLWTEADRIIDTIWPNGYPHDWSYIHFDGVDFSDTVEVWWILQDSISGNNVAGFWNKYVTNAGGGGGGGSPTYRIANNNQVYKWNGSSFSVVGGALVKIDVGGNDKPWGINAGGGIYQRNGGSWTWRGNGGRSIAVGTGNNIFLTKTDDSIWKWNGGTFVPFGPSGGRLRTIDTNDVGGLWGINAAGFIFQWNGGGWSYRGSGGQDIGVGSGNNVFLTKTDGRIYKWNGSSFALFAGGRLSKIDVDQNGTPWGVNAGGNLYQWNGSGWTWRGSGNKEVGL